MASKKDWQKWEPDVHLRHIFLLSGLCLLFAAPEHSPVTNTLIFYDVTVIDATGMPARPHETVIIKGDRIVQIGSVKDVPVPKNAQVIDGRGLYLIPGLWDMHVHVWETRRSFPMFIANGVTGVRNMGGHLDQLKSWRDQTADGSLLGPRMILCGPVVDGPNPSHPDHSIVVRDAAEGRKAVEFLIANGADFVKVYDGVPRDAYFAIANEAKKKGIPFVGHVPEAISPSEASNAGQASIEHLVGIVETVSTKSDEIRAIGAVPVKSPAEYPGRIAKQLRLAVENQSAQKLAELAALFVKNHTWQVPTLTAKKYIAFTNDANLAKDPRVVYLTAAEREGLSPEKNMFVRFSPPEYWVQRRAEFQVILRIVSELHRAGVPILAGTDAAGYSYIYYGFSLHDELAFLVQTGFTPMEALQAATIKPAQFLGVADRLGTITLRKQADLVLLSANPLEDIRNTQKIQGVVVRGKYFNRAALDGLLKQAETVAAEKN
jgi:imidazolonepropionase-like amidohydrolase